MSRRILAPLRRIIFRELIQDQPDPRVRRYIYALRDTMECGHRAEHYLFGGLRDMLLAYTDSPIVRARRHRCTACAGIVATRKPVQSVAAVAKAGAA